MRLKKLVPKNSQTRTLEILSIKNDWLKMSPVFRSIRGNFRNKMDRCHWCKRKFQDGDTMALAITPKGNKTLCQQCAGEVEE